MAERIRKFVTRAPRYVLRPQDRNVMRFSLGGNAGAAGVEETIILNLSETGVAFLATPHTLFEIGERIKVEIPIPNSEQIAWFGRVVRIEELESNSWFFGNDPFKGEKKLFIALKFESLPEAHSRALRKGIEQSFLQAMRDQQYRTLLYYKVFFFQHVVQFLTYALLTALTIGAIYWLSRPTETYDEKRGSPWGQRFKF